jgi:hypothetical protein
MNSIDVNPVTASENLLHLYIKIVYICISVYIYTYIYIYFQRNDIVKVSLHCVPFVTAKQSLLMFKKRGKDETKFVG